MKYTSIPKLYSYFERFPHANTDTRKVTKGSIFFALKGANFDGNQFAAQALRSGAAYAVVDDPNVVDGDQFLLVENVLTALQELANHHRKSLKTPIIGITGSNGKTTTKELMHAVLNSHFKTFATQGNFNNHIGVPLSLLSITKDHELAIIEMGANHVGEIKTLSEIAEPNIGLITNIGSAHLEGFGGIEGVKRGKTELYRFLLANNGEILVNKDDETLIELAGTQSVKYYSKDLMKISDVAVKPFLSFTCDELKVSSQLIGAYNLPNMLAAIAVGDYYGVPRKKAVAAISQYTPNNQRSQLIEKGGLHIILDAYNANPVSMKAAIDNLALAEADHKLVILGDMKELGDESIKEHRVIADIVSECIGKNAIYVGPEFKKAVGDQVSVCNNFEEVASLLKTSPIEQGTLLLIKGSRSMQLEKLLDYL